MEDIGEYANVRIGLARSTDKLAQYSELLDRGDNDYGRNKFMTCKIDILQARDAGQIVAPLRLLEREHGHSPQYRDVAVGIIGYMRIVLDLSMFPVVFEWCSLSIHVMNSLIGLTDLPTSIFSVSGDCTHLDVDVAHVHVVKTR